MCCIIRSKFSVAVIRSSMFGRRTYIHTIYTAHWHRITTPSRSRALTRCLVYYFLFRTNKKKKTTTHESFSRRESGNDVCTHAYMRIHSCVRVHVLRLIGRPEKKWMILSWTWHFRDRIRLAGKESAAHISLLLTVSLSLPRSLDRDLAFCPFELTSFFFFGCCARSLVLSCERWFFEACIFTTTRTISVAV